MPQITIENVEDRLHDLQPVIDGVTLDLANAGITNLGDLDPEEFEERDRHYILAWNRLYQVVAELSKTGVAIDPEWVPPPTDTTRKPR